jgi:nitrogen fixation NifU-like protein
MSTQATPPLDELYREVVLDHYRNPRHRGALAAPTGHFEGMNPVCGDEVTLDLRIENGRIEGIGTGGRGCSISQASASMLADWVEGRELSEVREAIGAVRHMLQTGEPPRTDMGDIEALAGVAQFPVRVKCALLSWNVLEQGLDEITRAA